MSNDPVIPECYTSRLPFPTDGQVIGCVEVLSQEVQRVNGFLAFQFGNVDQESRIVKQRFNLRDWVSSDLASISLAVRNRVRRTYQGMLATDWSTEWSSAPVDRVYKDVLKGCVSKKKKIPKEAAESQSYLRAVYTMEAFEQLLESWAEFIEERGLTGENGVAAEVWCSNHS
jgi:hypothetical protein